MHVFETENCLKFTSHTYVDEDDNRKCIDC